MYIRAGKTTYFWIVIASYKYKGKGLHIMDDFGTLVPTDTDKLAVTLSSYRAYG